MATAQTPVVARLERGQIAAERYRFEEFLGGGGTGEVWRATDLRLERTVAVKVLRAELFGGGLGARVEQEAKAASRIRHPAVVDIYDLGRLDSGIPFVAMEFLEGQSLASLLEKRGRLGVLDAVSALLPIADALAACHAVGVVHRDVKPDNIFLATLTRGLVQPKVVDFGVAKLAGASSPRLTVVGTVVGTPLYMAPEQALGDVRVFAPADVWALGVTLYEMVVGRPPFEGDALEVLFSNIVSAPLPFPRDLEDFDTRLFSILAAATRKRASERITIDELTLRLRDYLRERGVTSDLAGRSLETYCTDFAPSSVPVSVTLGGAG